MSDRPSPKQKILFLCTGNACRSQMAEGWARALKDESIEASSAGIERHGLNPSAVKVMSEAGVDISAHLSKTLDDIPEAAFDYVITVCSHAHETCPRFPGQAKVVHIGFDDPPRLARHAKSEEETLPHFRRVRDEIRQFVETLPESLEERWKRRSPEQISRKGAKPQRERKLKKKRSLSAGLSTAK